MTELETMGGQDESDGAEEGKRADNTAGDQQQEGNNEEDTVHASAPSEQEPAREFNEQIYDEMI